MIYVMFPDFGFSMMVKHQLFVLYINHSQRPQGSQWSKSGQLSHFWLAIEPLSLSKVGIMNIKTIDTFKQRLENHQPYLILWNSTDLFMPWNKYTHTRLQEWVPEKSGKKQFSIFHDDSKFNECLLKQTPSLKILRLVMIIGCYQFKYVELCWNHGWPLSSAMNPWGSSGHRAVGGDERYLVANLTNPEVDKLVTLC